MNREVFLSLLALDSYNRDYGASISISGSSIGNASIKTRQSLGVTQADYVDWQNAGFYAIAYDWNGETVISYRGTNFPTDFTDLGQISALLSDAFGGWSLGLGIPAASQASLAVDFYKDVTYANSPIEGSDFNEGSNKRPPSSHLPPRRGPGPSFVERCTKPLWIPDAPG